MLHIKRKSRNRLALSVFFTALMMMCSATCAKQFAPDVGMASSASASKEKPLKEFTAPRSLPALMETRAGSDWYSFYLSSGFVNAPLWQSMRIMTFMNMVGFLISLETKSQLHTDLLGTGAFVAAATPPLLNSYIPLRIKLSCVAVMVWGIKLTFYLVFRLLKQGHDNRLVEMLSTNEGSATFWITSYIWATVCSLPHTLGTTSPIPGNDASLAIGGAMYIAGLIMETLADYQKWIFKAANPGKICNVGLWSVSQHPNFFGNLLLWAGIFVMNAPALIEPVPPGSSRWEKIMGYRRLVVACLSPWFMWNLFYGQATGTLSDTVNLAATKYAKDPKYQEYVRTVPLIIPNPFIK